MDTAPPGKSTSREIVERISEAAIGSVPLIGNALAVTFVTALNWRLEQRREKWFTELAEGVEKLRERVDDFDLETLAGNDLFVDAVVTATRTVEHTHQEDKIRALRNAVLNSIAPDAPDADTQAIMLNLIDRFMPSHLRLLALWNDPPAWFKSHGLTPPQAAMAGSRTQTVDAGLPEMRGRQDFYLRIASELGSGGMLAASLSGMVSGSALMDRLTTDFGRQFVRFISARGEQRGRCQRGMAVLVPPGPPASPPSRRTRSTACLLAARCDRRPTGPAPARWVARPGSGGPQPSLGDDAGASASPGPAHRRR
jgi:hypothetical protein